MEISFERRRIWWVIAAFSIGMTAYLTMGSWINIIYNMMEMVTERKDSSYLLIAMVILFAMNCIRTTPMYLGAILLVEGIEIRIRNKEIIVSKVLIAIIVMIAEYHLIETLVGADYDFGTPAIVSLCLVFILKKMHMFGVSIFSKGVIIATVILTMQTLTTIPALTQFGFGRGEIAVDIKQLSVLLGYSDKLIMFSLFLFGSILCFFFVVIKLVKDEYQLKISAQQKAEMESRLTTARLEALELRTLKEIQNLVHDLKTPLTTVQGLASLCELLEKDDRIKEYQSRIVSSVDSMNSMISEILYEDRKNIVTVRELFNTISTYIAINEKMSREVRYENHCSNNRLRANKIRLIRAIINVIENSSAAVSDLKEKQPDILLKAEMDQDRICITITDNGIGILPEELEKIWDSGFSAKGSTGLGLSFTRSVIENHGGEIQIQSSRKHGGTVVSIWLKEEKFETKR